MGKRGRLAGCEIKVVYQSGVWVARAEHRGKLAGFEMGETIGEAVTKLHNNKLMKLDWYRYAKQEPPEDKNS